MEDDGNDEAEIDEFAMFQARALGAESEYLLLKQASRHHHHQQGTAAAPRSSPRPGTTCIRLIQAVKAKFHYAN